MLDVLKAWVTIKPTELRQKFSGTAAFVPISGSIRHSNILALLLNLSICFMGCN